MTDFLHKEIKLDCIICGKSNADKAHIKTKGSGGPDDDSNIMFLCRIHHVEQHKIGIITFIEKYPSVKKTIEAKGWEIVLINGFKKLRRVS
jgi:hypothetical protein